MTSDENLFKRQEQELIKLADRKVVRFLNLVDFARKSIRKEIESRDSITSRNYFGIVKQLDFISEDLRDKIKTSGLGEDKILDLVTRHFQEVMQNEGAPSLVVSFNEVNIKALRLISDSTLNHVSSIPAVEIDYMKRELFISIGVKGENAKALARRLAGPGSPITAKYHHIENVVRTEVNRIYNHQTEEIIKQINEDLDEEDKVNKRIIETIDSSRNHPISQVLHGLIQEQGKPFRIRVSDVQAAAKRMGKKFSRKSIFWEEKGGYFVGNSLPAHFQERGRIVPTIKAVNVK